MKGGLVVSVRCIRSKVSHVCYAKDKNHPSYLLFEARLYPMKKDPIISIYDVRDAYECCSVIANQDMKRDCYLQFGIDGEMVEKYYKKVETMEKLYKMPNKN